MSTTETPATYVNGEPIEGEEDNSILSVVEDQLDDLEIQVATREWEISGKLTIMNPQKREEEEIDFTRTYWQKPLSYTAMLQFTGLIGDRISTVMTMGVTLESILGDVGSIAAAMDGGLTREDFSGIDSFVHGLAKLAAYIPDIVEECQCIWLRIPMHERPIVKEIWSRAPEDGGQSMDDGEEMLNLFIAQNYQELEDFFVERLPRVLKRAQAARTSRKQLGAAGRRLSRHSNSTPAVTPSE